MKIQLPHRLILLAVVLATSFGTIFWGYEQPANLFWDENYHIASAQKYLHGVFFMEPHPPLGKLLVAAGEWLFSPNADSNQYLDTNYAPKASENFSFKGYRFFPTLCATFVPVLIFLALESLLGSAAIAFAIGMMVALDNAYIVHVRSAMLEGPQIFFLACSALCCARVRKNERAIIPAWVWFGAAMAVKVNSLALAPVLFESSLRVGKRPRLLLAAFAACALLYLSIWVAHVSIARTINPKLDQNGLYKASTQYQEYLQGTRSLVTALPFAIRDNIFFSESYQGGVPRLNLCKPDENGSFPLLWPLGASSINYRWERINGITQYLYLQANPLVWLVSLLGFLLAATRSLCAKLGHPVDTTDLRKSNALLFVYFLVIMSPLMLARVFYLYHFFIGLFAGLVLFGIEIRVQPLFKRYAEPIAFGALALCLLSFIYFAPLTYYVPLSPSQVAARNWFPLWDLRCAGCARQNPLARPIPPPSDRNKSSISSNSSVIQSSSTSN